jgi:superfamily II DNA/RNA helicase
VILCCRLAAAVQRIGIESFFPVQVATWLETVGPGAFQRDICINSPTGSGKTLAYALPIVQMLSTRKVRCLRALVVLPTRDLALQVCAVSFGPSRNVYLIAHIVNSYDSDLSISYSSADINMWKCSSCFRLKRFLMLLLLLWD